MTQQLLEKILIYYPFYGVVIYLIFTLRNISKNKPSVDQYLDLKKSIEKLEEKFKEYADKKEVKYIEKNVDKAHVKIEELDKKVDKEIAVVKTDISRVNISIEDRIKSEIEKSIQLKMYMTNEEKMRLDMKLLEDQARRTADLDVFDKKLQRISHNVIDMYFNDNYLNNKSFDINTGKYKMPIITEETKKNDIIQIYENFMMMINKKFLIYDLSLLFEVNTLEFRTYIIEHYLIPYYTERLEKIKMEYSEEQLALEAEHQKTMEREKAKRIRESEEKSRRESEIGQLEDKINTIFNEMSTTE